MNQELSDVQAEFRKGRGTREQIANIHWIINKAREFQKNIYFCFIDYIKAFNFMVTTNWKILKEVRIPDHLSCLLKHLYVAQEATGRILHGTTDWFKTEKGVRKSYTISLCSFNLYAEYIMWNARIDEA